MKVLQLKYIILEVKMKKYIKYIKFTVALTLFFFGSLLQYIPILIFKINKETMSTSTSVALSTFSNIICFTILVLMYRKSIVEGIKDLKKKKYKPLLDGFNYWFIGLMVMVLSNTLISFINGGATSTNEESVRIMLSSSWLTLLSISILSPVIEELVFRKAFSDIFKNKWVYLTLSGLLFGALHVLLSPVTSFIDYLYLIPYCSMGLAFAYTQYKTNNIIPSITMHIIHNTINAISVLFLAGVAIW